MLYQVDVTENSATLSLSLFASVAVYRIILQQR